MERLKSEFAYRLVAGTVRLFLRGILRWRWNVTGIDRVPAGASILAFNHISYTDAFVTGLPLVAARRRARFLVKRELFSWPVIGWLATKALMIPVDRGDRSARAQALDEAVSFLEAGELVLIAPEQTISRSFELLPLRTGAVRIAQQAGVPIVPSANWGSQRFMTKGRARQWRFRLPVEVAYGEPIHIGSDDDPAEVTARLETAMQKLLEACMARYPDAPTRQDDWWQPARLGGSAPDHDTVVAEHRARGDLA
jgi:1-acyl-sn-glycerol-3-phosphate acyltransferase